MLFLQRQTALDFDDMVAAMNGNFASSASASYGLFDNESGEAVIVDGLANKIEGGENIVKGLVEAGRLPVNAVFNVDLNMYLFDHLV